MFGPSRRVARRTARRTSRRQARFRMGPGAYDEQEPASEYAPPPAETSDYVEELQKLAKLKEQGILTEEEFQAKKKHILGL